MQLQDWIVSYDMLNTMLILIVATAIFTAFVSLFQRRRLGFLVLTTFTLYLVERSRKIIIAQVDHPHLWTPGKWINNIFNPSSQSRPVSTERDQQHHSSDALTDSSHSAAIASSVSTGTHHAMNSSGKGSTNRDAHGAASKGSGSNRNKR